MNRFGSATAWIQGVYFAVTGIWPLVSIETFQKVSGKKLITSLQVRRVITGSSIQ
jgi:hypothetical protein